MLKKSLFVVCLLVLNLSFAQGHGEIFLTDEKLEMSLGEMVLVYHDSSDRYETYASIENLPDEAFVPGDEPILNFDFTASRYWLKFTVTNKSSYSHFIFETGRTVSNKVELFELEQGQLVNHYLSGDDYSYYEKEILHRKSIFPVRLDTNTSKTFYVKLESDGELLFVPVFMHERMAFFAQDFKDQFKNGFYYGLIALVVIIYFFFYIFLRDKAYLFYILYAFSQGMLQFFLDGYAHHHFIPNGGYFASHLLLVFAGLTVVFLLTYVNNFLKLKSHSPVLWKVFYISRILMFLIILMSLIPGTPYEISFPIINGASLFSVLMAAFSIIRLRIKGVEVDLFFALAFIILIVGGVVFILGNLSIVGDKIVSLGALKISSAIEFVVLSISMSNKYGKLQREKEEAQKLALKNLQEKNELMDQSNTQLERQVKERTSELELQKEALAKSNDEIVSSIKYAKRIQQAILPSDEDVKMLLPESFILYRPKDVVSGDFYFVESTKTTEETPRNFVVFGAIDCTGHGVPGAFMSIVGNNLLVQSLTEKEVNTPAQALHFLNKGVQSTLRREVEGRNLRDGMDMALCAVDFEKRKLYFAGAKNPLYLIRKKANFSPDILGDSFSVAEENEELVMLQVKGDKHAIGYAFEDLKPFTHHELSLEEGDQVVIFTDGYADQFGGEKGKKYNYRRFRKYLLAGYDKSMAEQHESLSKEFDRWSGDNEQIDDVLVVSVRF